MWTLPAKRYTFILKDELLSKNPENGREQATISYEYDFEASTAPQTGEKSTSVFIPWSNLTPTYRGKEKKDAAPIDLTSVKRISIMMRRLATAQVYVSSIRSMTDALQFLRDPRGTFLALTSLDQSRYTFSSGS